MIAIKSVGDLKEGGIYFRYVGETRLIKPGELRQIMQAREQKAVEAFSRRMSRVATGSEATIDLDTGEVAGRAGRFLIDKELLPSIQSRGLADVDGDLECTTIMNLSTRKVEKLSSTSVRIG